MNILEGLDVKICDTLYQYCENINENRIIITERQAIKNVQMRTICVNVLRGPIIQWPLTSYCMDKEWLTWGELNFIFTYELVIFTMLNVFGSELWFNLVDNKYAFNLTPHREFWSAILFFRC